MSNLQETRLTQEQKQWLLDFTVKYYGEDPKRRALNKNGFCAYLNEKGDKCAIGVHLENPGIMEEMAYEQDIGTVLDKVEEDGVQLVLLLDGKRVLMQGDDWEFYSAIQGLHDEEGYWSDTDMNKDGVTCANVIAKDFDLKLPFPNL